MTTSVTEVAQNATRKWWAWWPVLLGLSVMYVPTYYDMAHTTWSTDEGAHGPMVIGVSLWLIWQCRNVVRAADQRCIVRGGVLLCIGLLIYIVGRSQSIFILESASQMVVLGGILLAMCGWKAIRALAFPLLFLIFAVPLPSLLVDSLTVPLKSNISVFAEWLLYSMGYPVARDGVMLAVGRYQLQVADACSGLHSLFSLTALGLLYIYLMKYRSRFHNGFLLLCILPIALLTNVIRVILLVLITYHFGDAAAQGAIHGVAGIAMFMIAMSILFMTDAFFRWFIVHRLGVALR